MMNVGGKGGAPVAIVRPQVIEAGNGIEVEQSESGVVTISVYEPELPQPKATPCRSLEALGEVITRLQAHDELASNFVNDLKDLHVRLGLLREHMNDVQDQVLDLEHRPANVVTERVVERPGVTVHETRVEVPRRFSWPEWLVIGMLAVGQLVWWCL